MNLVTNIHNAISSVYKYICMLVYIETYNIIYT